MSIGFSWAFFPRVLVVVSLLAAPLLAHGGQYTAGQALIGLGGSSSGPRPAGISLPGTDATWQNWWEHNSEEFLDARDRKERQAEEAAQKSTAGAAPIQHSLSNLDARNLILPTLTRLLETESSTEILDAAAIAVGRIGGPPESEHLVSLMAHKNPKIREAGILAMGLVQDPRAAEVLAATLNSPLTDYDDRGLAAIALGLSGCDSARPALENRLGQRSPIKGASRAKTRQLDGCRALGLGLLANPDCVDVMAARFKKHASKDANFVPMLLTGMARLDEPRAAATALAAIKNRKNDVRRSGWILAGRSIDGDKKKETMQLIAALKKERDRHARGLACITLGRIGNEPAIKHLTRLWSRGGNRQERCFAAIGLGISGNLNAITALRGAVSKERDLALRGANAIALGIAGDAESGPVLVSILQKVGNPELRAHLIWALGMLEYKEALPVLRKIAAKARQKELVVACGLALGVIGDGEAVNLLIRLLQSSGSFAVKGAMARALGRLGDRSVVDPLLKLASNRKEPNQTRAFAVVALGLLGDKKPRNELSRISIDSNYGILGCDVLHRVLDIF